VFRHTLNAQELSGNYVWLAAFTEPGTGNIVGAVARAPFLVSR
jgi:hypothetical protein